MAKKTPARSKTTGRFLKRGSGGTAKRKKSKRTRR
jgi:hypothetical protein